MKFVRFEKLIKANIFNKINNQEIVKAKSTKVIDYYPSEYVPDFYGIASGFNPRSGRQENMQNSKLEKIIGLTLAIYTSLTPLWFLPIFADFYLMPKVLLTLIAGTLLIILSIYHGIVNKSFKLVVYRAHLPVFFVLITFLASAFIQSPNQTEAWISRGMMLLSLAAIYFAVSNFPSKRYLGNIKFGIVVAGSVLSVIALYQVMGITGQVAPQLSWLENKLWNPTGSPVSLLLVIVSGAVLSLLWGLKKGGSVLKSGTLLFLVLIQVIAAAVVINELLPGKENTMLHLPYAYGYSIAIDTLKNWRTALFGVGPDNFLSAFTQFKPLAYNSSDKLWNVRFSSSSNEILHAMTTTGLIGLIAYIYLFYYLAKSAINNWKTNLEWSLLITILVLFLFLFVANTTTLAWIFLLLIAGNMLAKPRREVMIGNFSTIGLVSGLVATGLLGGLYYGYKFGLAEIYFRQAVITLSQNQGVPTYNAQRQTLLVNPYRVGYRIAYARTNLALATNLAQQANLTQEDTKRIVQLIQQGVRESRAAVQLNQQNVNAWENLAQTYKQLVNFANNSDQFAVQSYNQALLLDPRNPRLWVDYGGMLMSLGNLDGATAAYRQAVALKRDYANAHFNLANALKADKKYAQAYNEMQRVMEIVDPSSADYLTARKAAEELKVLADEQSPGLLDELPDEGIQEDETPTLTVPSPAPEKPEGLEVIELEEEGEPEEAGTVSPKSKSVDGAEKTEENFSIPEVDGTNI